MAGEQLAVWCVCDGHHGQGAAAFVARQSAEELLHRLRENCSPSEGGLTSSSQTCAIMQLFELSHEADELIYVLIACADLTIAAGQLRQTIADTFVSLAESWELGKKFSGEYAVKYAGCLNTENQHPVMR